MVYRLSFGNRGQICVIVDRMVCVDCKLRARTRCSDILQTGASPAEDLRARETLPLKTREEKEVSTIVSNVAVCLFVS